MIIKMRKYSFLIYHKFYLDFLEKIREIGVLHVIEKAEGFSEDDMLNSKMQLSSTLQTALTELKKYMPENAVFLQEDKKVDGNVLLKQVEELFLQLETLTQELLTARRELERITVWGDFSIQRMQTLEDAGFELRFYNCNVRKFNPEWESLYNAFEVSTVGPIKYFVTVNKPGTTIDIDADPMKMPGKNMVEMTEEIASLMLQMEALKKDIEKTAIERYKSLEHYYQEVLGEIDFSKVILNTKSEVENKVMLLEGFCPDEAEAPLQEYLDKSGVFYQMSDPDITEDIPIKLKNNAFSKLFEPITNLFSLPNYSELDPTPFLAPFFMLFFGLCLGDGGYGLIIWAVATFMKRKSKPEMKGLLSLGQYLGLATVLVGILTGSFFGIALDQVEWKWLAGVKQYFVTQDNFGDKLGGYNPMMIVALVIGMIQILFGMVVNTMKVNKQHGFKYALGHIAWIVFIVSIIVYVVLSGTAISPVFMYIIYGFIGLSVLVILFYNSPGKNIFLNLGSALWNTYNMATGLLGDTLSYIRLFALGLTGSILGGVFNMLAIDMTADIQFAPGRWLAILLILLVGHTINFALCLIGAFVHPMRLTFVEFYKNAGFEGGGKAYKPFKKVQ
jgi:V/A-type H+-transporting ATPase subunit I